MVVVMLNQKRYEERLQRAVSHVNGLGVGEEHSSHFGFSSMDMLFHNIHLELEFEMMEIEDNE